MRLVNITLAKDALSRALTPWEISTSVIAFIGDFLKPEENIAPYILLASGIALLILLAVFRNRAKAEGLEQAFNSDLGGLLAFFALSTVAWTALTFLFMATPPEGIAASMVPGIEKFQKDILKIGEDVTEIKGSVGRIEEKNHALSKQGTVIPNPKSPEEFYHNARFYEVKGNTGEALKAYEKFLELAPDYVDVHQAYQTLLNNTQGIEATRQTYLLLQGKYVDRPIVSMMAIRVLPDRGERLVKLQELSQKHSSVGPVYFELAQEYLRPGPGNVTIDEMKQAKAAFDQFKAQDDKGNVKSYYIDKKVLDEVYKKKATYDQMVASFYGAMIDQPVILKVELLPNLVGLTMVPKELKVQKIYYSIDDPNPTIDTGLDPWLKDPDTGQPQPSVQVSGKVAAGKHVLYVKYVNAQGQESPVSSLAFEVTPIRALAEPRPGDLGSASKNYQIDFQSLDGKDYEFFYSLDQPQPDKKVPGGSLALDNLPPGPHDFYYYGVSQGQKTSVYNLKISQ